MASGPALSGFEGHLETSFLFSVMQEFKGFWFRIIQEIDLVDLYSLEHPLVLDYKPKITKQHWNKHYCHVYGNLTTPSSNEDHSIARVQNAKGLLTFFILPPKFTSTAKVAPEIGLDRLLALTAAKNPLWGMSVHCRGPWLFPRYLIIINSDDVVLSLKEFRMDSYLDFANVFFLSFHYMRNLSFFRRHLYVYCRTCCECRIYLMPTLLIIFINPV